MSPNKKQKKGKKNPAEVEKFESKSEPEGPAQKKPTVKQLFAARKRKMEPASKDSSSPQTKSFLKKSPNKKQKKGKKNPAAVEKFESKSEPEGPAQKKPTVKQLFESRKRKMEPASKDSSSPQAKEAPEPVIPDTKKRKSLEKEGEKRDFPRGPERQAQRQRKKEAKKFSKRAEQHLARTVFVGNLPVSVTRKSLEKMFSKFGDVESVRLRGAIPVKAQIPKKVADITRTFHDGLHSRKGFVVFKHTEGAEEALTLNGTLIEDHHIIVDKASSPGQKKTYDSNRSVFLGNLPFDVDDEVVWNALSSFGQVEAVRIIRDQMTGAGKGFGYVVFKEESSRKDALAQETLDVEGRKIRIKSVEANKQKGTKKKGSFGLSLKAKNHSTNPNSRKSTKKLLKREKVKNEKKRVAENFKKFF